MSASMLGRAARGVQEGRTHLLRARSAMKSAAGDLAPIITALLLVAPVVAAALFYVWTRVSTVRLGYDLSRAGEMNRRLNEENRGLRIEVASLKAPERLKQLAETQYHLAPPRTQQVVRMESR